MGNKNCIRVYDKFHSWDILQEISTLSNVDIIIDVMSHFTFGCVLCAINLTAVCTKQLCLRPGLSGG